MISGLHCSLNEIFTLLRSYMEKLPMFWDNLQVLLSRVKQSKELDCLTLVDVINGLSQKSITYYQSMLHKIPEEQRPSFATSSSPLWENQIPIYYIQIGFWSSGMLHGSEGNLEYPDTSKEHGTFTLKDWKVLE